MALSPEQWLPRLEAELSAQQRLVKKPDDYYDGRQDLGFASQKFLEAFGPWFEAFAVNWCSIIVDAPTERLAVEGFRFGDGADQAGDDQAWEIWQSNFLDADSSLLHAEAIKLGRGYILTDPTPVAAGREPRITVEHPSQVVVITSGGNRRIRLAALKKWDEGDGTLRANVYLPEATYKFEAKTGEQGGLLSRALARVRTGSAPAPGFGSWRRIETVANPLGVVTMVPMFNRPTMLSGGKSDLDDAIPVQDAINKETADMLVSSEFQAFRQRVLIGAEVPTDPETGQPMAGAELKAMQSRLWVLPEGASIAEYSEAQLQNYVTAIESLRKDLAALTRTPAHYVAAGDIANVSGDALKAMEAGLVAKVIRKQQDFGEAWEEAMRHAFLAKGDTKRGRAMRAHTIWRDPENRTPAETVDATVKLQALGIPREVLWKRAGFSQQEVDSMKKLAPVQTPPPSPAPAPVLQ